MNLCTKYLITRILPVCLVEYKLDFFSSATLKAILGNLENQFQVTIIQRTHKIYSQAQCYKHKDMMANMYCCDGVTTDNEG